MNIAIGTSRLGLKVGAITGVGKEGNGDYIKWQHTRSRVDISHIKTDPARLTAMVLLSIRGKDDFPLIQYRENCADMGLRPEDIDPDYLAQAKAVLVTGIHLSQEGVRAATMKILETAKSLGLRCILDIDFRPNLWGLQGHDAGSSRWAQASERVTNEYRKVLPYFDLIVGTEEEYFIASGKTEPIAALREVRRMTKAVLIHKLGDRGCAALDGDIPDSFTDDVVQPGFPVKVFNSIGAGDGFMSGFLRGWLRGEDLPTCCRYANAAGAFAVSRLGCSSAYPSWTEMQYFLEHGSKEKWLRHDAMLEQIHWSTNRRVKWHDLAVLAFDHRLVFRQLADEYGRSDKDISAFKQLIYKAALEVAGDSVSSGNQIGILADDTYGLDVLLESNHHPVWVGRCIEQTNVSPLAFEGLPDVGSTLQSWPENHVVKCLFRPHASDAQAVREENEKQLRRLFSASAARDTNCFWNSFLKAATGTLICWPGWSSAMSWACIPTTGRFCLRNGKRPGRVWKSSSCVTIPTAAAYSFSATTPRNRSCVRPLPIFPTTSACWALPSGAASSARLRSAGLPTRSATTKPCRP